MSDETTNLVLEQLRLVRSEISALREESKASFQGLNGRVDLIETELRGLSYIVTVSIGSLLGDMKDLKTRVSTLEGHDRP